MKDNNLTNKGLIAHPLPPLFNKESRVLILGTFPSVKSREGRFFYHHPQNRFWKVIAAITGSPEPKTIEEKKAIILDNNIALWDVVLKCWIHGSSDSSIRNVVPSDLDIILDNAPIERIYANGGTAYKLYMKHSYNKTGRMIIKLPSTSPANAAWSLDRLIDQWEVIRDYLATSPVHSSQNTLT